MSGIYGVRLDQDNFLTGVVTTGGQLIGWEFPGVVGDVCYVFRKDISEFHDATEVAGALTIKGLDGGSVAAMIRWNAVPMTEEELTKVEQDERRIMQGVLNPLLNTYSLNDLRRAALISQGYTGHNNDMLREWYADNGAGLPLRHINDMLKDFLIFQGFTPALNYTANDAWYAFLGAQGFTQGHVNDREVEFWRANGVIT